MSSSAITPPASTSLFVPRANAAQAASGSTASTTSSSGTGLTGTTAGTTFLNLLVKELQNQDPSAPMDSTAMVGQMISLNQLDQLIGINQHLTPATASAVGKTVAASATSDSNSASASARSADLLAQKSALLGASDSASSAAASAAMLAASSSNTTLNLSQFTNQFGGK